MGAINYRTSDYITLAMEPLTPVQLGDGATWEDVEDAEGAIIRAAEEVLEDYPLYYFRARLLPGYYKGVQLDLEYNFPVCLEDAEDKRDALREVTLVGRMLRELVDAGLTVCRPGWCAWYGTRVEALCAVREAVRAMREDVRRTPTVYTMRRAECGA